MQYRELGKGGKICDAIIYIVLLDIYVLFYISSARDNGKLLCNSYTCWMECNICFVMHYLTGKFIRIINFIYLKKYLHLIHFLITLAFLLSSLPFPVHLSLPFFSLSIPLSLHPSSPLSLSRTLNSICDVKHTGEFP